MKRLFVTLALLASAWGITLGSQGPSASAVPESGWRIYRSKSLGVSFQLPEHWVVDDEDPKAILITTVSGQWDDVSGRTTPLEPWLGIFQDESCQSHDSAEPPFTYQSGGRWELQACRGGVSVYLGFWDKDPNLTPRRNLLLIMLRSVQSLH